MPRSSLSATERMRLWATISRIGGWESAMSSLDIAMMPASLRGVATMPSAVGSVELIVLASANQPELASVSRCGTASWAASVRTWRSPELRATPAAARRSKNSRAFCPGAKDAPAPEPFMSPRSSVASHLPAR